MAEVTDADREKAIAALGYDGWDYSVMADGPKFDVDAVAAALAAEREKARAPFRELAAEFTSYSREDEENTMRADSELMARVWRGSSTSWRAASNRISRAAEESQ